MCLYASIYDSDILSSTGGWLNTNFVVKTSIKTCLQVPVTDSNNLSGASNDSNNLSTVPVDE